MRCRLPNMWCWFPGLRWQFMRPSGGPNRLKNLGTIAKELLTSGCDASASLSSNRRPDSRVERRSGRRTGVEGRAEPDRFRGTRVLKFGGSSLATPDCIKDVGRIVRNTVNGTGRDGGKGRRRCVLRLLRYYGGVRLPAAHDS